MFKTIDSKLKVFFNIPIAVIILCGALYFASDYVFSQILNIENNLETLRLKEKEKATLEGDFLTFEPTNPLFFETHQSIYIDKIKKTNKAIDSLIVNLKNESNFIKIPNYQNKLDTLKKILDKRTSLFNNLDETIYEIGNKDHGLMSKMRSNIHYLENHISNPNNMVALLTIRRHEKDYLLRFETKYIELFNKKVINYQQNINHLNINQADKDTLSSKLTAYSNYFVEIVDKTNSIGGGKNLGLAYHLKFYNLQTEAISASLIKAVYNQEAFLKKVLRITYAIAISSVLILTFFLNSLLHKQIGLPLHVLATSIDQIVENNFTYKKDTLIGANRNDEIGSLSRSMNFLLVALNNWKSKLEQQTNAIIEQKQLLDNKNTELNSYIGALNTIKNEITEQHNTLEKKNRNIHDSLNYASRIQQSLLPSTNTLKELLPDHFIYYLPKDIVSGDFYWYVQLENKLYITVADCTGHGVPGAFMSLLGISSLKDIINSQPFLSASEILNFLRQEIKDALSSSDTTQRMREGMDMAFCIIDFETQKLQYAGAYNPVYIVRNGELTTFKPDKMPIGHHLKEHPYFTDHEFQLQNDDRIYLFSDGYLDQIGGENNKKFMKRKFQQLLCDISLKPMNQQAQILDITLHDWMKNTTQVDDVCIIGLNFQSDHHQINDLSQFDLSNKNFLIAEDNFAHFLLLKKAITDAGGTITHAQTGIEAVDAALKSHFDLVIMDLFLPELDGFGAINEIRKTNTTVPIIVQTSAVFGNERERAFEMGCADFLKKPLKKFDVLSSIKQTLNNVNVEQ